MIIELIRNEIMSIFYNRSTLNQEYFLNCSKEFKNALTKEILNSTDSLLINTSEETNPSGFAKLVLPNIGTIHISESLNQGYSIEKEKEKIKERLIATMDWYETECNKTGFDHHGLVSSLGTDLTEEWSIVEVLEYDKFSNPLKVIVERYGK